MVKFTTIFSFCAAVIFSISIFPQELIKTEKTGTIILNPEYECTGEGELIYDDGSFEQAYSYTANDSARIVMLFTPDQYPYSVSTFCLILTNYFNQDSLNFNIVVYDTTGTYGSPGNLIATYPAYASGIPLWPDMAWYNYDISTLPPLNSGSYYIGIKYPGSEYTDVHFGADESAGTPLQPGYVSPTGAYWLANQLVWPDYKAMGMRISSVSPCPGVKASDPNPPDLSTGIPADLPELSWVNGNGAVSNELFLGTDITNLNLVQSGTLATSYSFTQNLEYNTTYYWKVTEIGDTCIDPGAIWRFTTENFPVVDSVIVYPQSVDYWTGSTNGTIKTDVSEVRGVSTELGWMVFDVSAVPPEANIYSIKFYGYVNDTNFPSWSATPMGEINPVTAAADSISDQILSAYGQNTAYIYADEPSTFTTGWHSYEMTNNVIPDFQAALYQDRFALGIVDRDFFSEFFIIFDGWAQNHPPYLVVYYGGAVPVELTSFTGSVEGNNVDLSWTASTQLNNKGFEIERKPVSGSYRTISFVKGDGTTSELRSFTYRDRELSEGDYAYRLKQIDFDGSFSYSGEVNVSVETPSEFTLSQNYPNPFNPSTNISYSIPVESHVSINVYDGLGRLVTTLVNKVEEPGRYTATWNGSNSSHQKAAAGIYIYRIEAGKYVDTKKMILLK